MKIGLFGGTFDPIHVAHLILAEEACAQLDLDRLDFILTPDPPHKDDNNVSPVEDRFKMLFAAIRNDSRFFLSRAEMDRPSPHFAVDTVEQIKNENVNAHICYVMGADSLRDLPTWHNASQFVEICDSIGVMQRPGDLVDLNSLEEVLPGVQEKIELIRGPLLDISGSKIRKNIKNNGPYRYYVPESVYTIIEMYRLYR
jgi:nicotinate-nucleotide adenylyltransferase